MSNLGATCRLCGKESSSLLTYSEFGGVRPCKIKDVNSQGQEIYRDSMEPFYKEEIELCYGCYRSITRKECQKETKPKEPDSTVVSSPS